MNLEHLRRFCVIAECQTFGEAAARLNLQQSGISRLVMELESDLGIILFARHSRGISLTAQGDRVYKLAKKLFHEADVIERMIHDDETEIKGDLSILTTPHFGAEWLVPNLKEFLQLYPKVTMKIVLQLDAANLSEHDVGIFTYFPNQPYLIQHPLKQTKTKLYASVEYLKKQGMPQNVADLNNHQFISQCGNQPSQYGSSNWALNVGLQSTTLPRKSYFEVNSLHGLINAACSGYGIVELPEIAVQESMNLIQVLPELEGPEIEVFYTYHENRKESKKIKVLYEYLLSK